MSGARWIQALAGVLWVAGCAGPGGHPTGLDRHVRAPHYPPHWWTPVPEAEAASWEILPQAAGPGEVIVSKRHELGLLSNFAHTPFVFGGQRYPSLEGFWQIGQENDLPDAGERRALRFDRSSYARESPAEPPGA